MTLQGDRDTIYGTLHSYEIMKIYNKLVRNKILEIIEATGKETVTHILSQEE